MSLEIISLGTGAALYQKDRKHFSLLIKVDKASIWIDPSIKFDEKVDAIIVTQGDKDHWQYLDKYLSKYPNTPVYSVRGIIDRIFVKNRKSLRSITKPLKFDGLKIIFMSIPEMVGVPAIALKLNYKNKSIVIIPEFTELGKYEKEHMKGATWIVGIGEYDKRKKNDHKATFKELIELANELKPKHIYLTNLRKSVYTKYKKQMLRELKKFSGGILRDGSIF